jgi:GNAT superfamily N-acetyltransferase
MTEAEIRQAELDDHEAVASFTRETWADRDVGDYIPDVFPEWVEADGKDQRTVVVDVEGDVAGLCQGVILTEHEAWLQGMRVNPDYRGAGYGLAMVEGLFSWCRQRGASLARNMVFSWNDAGLGQSRAAGFEPATEARWAQPTPDPDADPALDVVEDPDAVWTCWQRSDASRRLSGLWIDPGESWSLSELTRDRLFELVDDQRVIALQDDSGTRAATARARTRERETDERVESVAIYGFSVWKDLESARALFDAVAADAASLGVDRTRVLVPETCRHVSDVAAARADASDEPIFVLEADLTTVA